VAAALARADELAGKRHAPYAPRALALRAGLLVRLGRRGPWAHLFVCHECDAADDVAPHRAGSP